MDYDLLGRSNFIDELLYWGQDYISESKFVIGIEGKWGSGKSTVISNATKKLKTKEDVVIIDDFEPWLYDNKKVLLANMLKRILSKKQLEIPESEIDRIISSVIKIILGSDRSNFINDLFTNESDEIASQTIKDINFLLNNKRIKILLIIDNLDRLHADNIYLILNVVQNVLNFRNLVIIMSYDHDDLEKKLDYLNISPGYIEKLVQKKIQIPIPSNDKLLSIFKKSLVSIFNGKTIKLEQDKLNPFLHILVKEGVGLREFKRYLNSIVLPMINSKITTNIQDTLVIGYIKFSDFRLFQKVNYHGTFFVSVDQPFSVQQVYLSEDEKNNQYILFFKQFDEYSVLKKELLSLLFPTYKNYFEKGNFNYSQIINSTRTSNEYRKLQREKRIYSSNFFDLYFTKDSNDESIMMDFTEKFAEKLNKSNSEEVNSLLNQVIELTEDDQSAFFVNLAVYLDNITQDKLIILTKTILEKYQHFKNVQSFFILNNKGKLSLALSDIFRLMTTDQIKIAIDKFVTQPEYLTIFLDAMKYLERTHSDIEGTTEKTEYLKKNIKLTAYLLIKNSEIDLYNKKYYRRKYIIFLNNLFKEFNDGEQVKKYVNDRLNDENVYRILNDLISYAEYASGKKYYHMLEKFEEIVDKNKLEKLLNHNEPKNSKQKFIKNVFENHYTGTYKVYDEVGIQVEESIDLEIID